MIFDENKYSINLYYDGAKNIKKYNLISCSAFISKTAYKDTIIYLNGLKELCNNFKLIHKNCVLRIYHDRSIIEEIHEKKNINQEVKNHWKPFFESIVNNKKKNIQLILYEFKQFQYKSGIHIGTFGSMARMLPLFENDKKVNLVNIVDIDLEINHNMIKIIKEVMNNWKKYGNFFWESVLCYFTNPWTNVGGINRKIYVRIRNGTILTDVKFPKKILKDFLTCVLNTCPDIKKYKKQLEDKNKFTSIKSFNKYKTTSSKKFFYGLDEFFTNKYLLTFLIKNKIKFSTYVKGDFFRTLNRLNHITDNYTKYTKNQEKMIRKYFKFILESEYDSKKSLQTLDNIYWKIMSKSKNIKKNQEIAKKKNYQFFIKNNDKKSLKKHMGLSDDDLECIRLTKMMYANKFLFVSYNKEGKINIIYKSLNEKTPSKKFNLYDHLTFYEFNNFITKNEIKNIQNEVKNLDLKNFKSHDSKLYRGGDWKSLVIIEDNNINLELLTKLPTVNKIYNKIQDMKLEILRLRILKLEKGSIITQHNDRHGNFGIEKDQKIRFQIPIFTNPKVIFYLWDWKNVINKIHMNVGNAYYIDVRKLHCVVNKGNSDRYHLVIDIKNSNFIDTTLNKLYKKNLNQKMFNKSKNKILNIGNIKDLCLKTYIKNQRKRYGLLK